MKIEQADSATVTGLWADIEPKIKQSAFAEQAAQAFSTALYSHFTESVVLARVFLSVPFGAMPNANKEFVRNLAQSAGGAADLRDSTPVLSLLGTSGQDANWNDRRKSKGHIGIPLISASFVGAIPMISRLLRELGVPIDWIDSHDSEIIKKAAGGSLGLFFVDDAGSAKDHEGRKIIVAQDFVSTYGVKSVFGGGEAYADGQMFVFVAFCRDAFSRETAEQFGSLTDSFKGSTASMVEAGKIFAN
jgi:hypothetical protein